MKQFVTLPRAIFPDSDIATRWLGRVFPDLAVQVVKEHPHEWRYSVAPQFQGATIYDEDLGENLRSQFNLEFDGLLTWRHSRTIDDLIWLEAFNHCWALLAWSQWIEKRKHEGSPPQRPLLVHVDAHDDLAPSSLLSTPKPGCFVAAVGEYEMNMGKSDEVAFFLEHGLVGIGSFILPFLWTVGECDILHLMPEEWPVRLRLDLPLHLQQRAELLGGGLEHLSCAIQEDHPFRNSSFSYSCARISDALNVQPMDNRPVLLDIDLDYFALFSSRTPRVYQAYNHYDRDRVAERIRKLGTFLRQTGLAERTEVVTIAYSPGFFPSGLWRDTLPRLFEELSSLLPHHRL